MIEKNFREERIERLLKELKYEVELGLVQREIPEDMSFQFIFPMSQYIKGGVVLCEFKMRAKHYYEAFGLLGEDFKPKLRVVKGGEDD